jgi:hypothetical protein
VLSGIHCNTSLFFHLIFRGHQAELLLTVSTHDSGFLT